jgi:hypothetical protein
MGLNTVSDRLCISLNSVGTAHTDPRPSVAKFMSDQDVKENQIPTFTKSASMQQSVLEIAIIYRL